MLTIYYTNKHGKEAKQWKVGDSKPVLTDSITIDYIEASKEELLYIKSNFTNIPIANKTSVLWPSPFAQFIYDNL